MQIKKFAARDMTEALSMIKREFGSDAVILSARSLKNGKGMFNYLRKPGVEVTAATDTYYSMGKGNKSFARAGMPYEAESMQLSYEDATNKKKASYQHQEKPYYLKYNINSSVGRKPDRSPDDEIFSRLKQLMLKQDVEKDIAAQWLEGIKRSLTVKNPLRREEVKQGMVQALNKIGAKVSPMITERKRRKAIAFIGPTGVGKTTTIAKLAAINAIKMKKSTALITLDDRRIAAIEQLKVNARIIGIPLEIALNKKELKGALKRFSNRDLILIDTPGMSQKNESQINELKTIFEGVSNIQIHLIMSAASNNSIMMNVMEKFKAISVNRLIFSKLDEGTTFGNIVNQMCRSKIPASYFTNGQEVPEHIEIASLDRLVSLIIDDAGEGNLWSPSSVIREREEGGTENGFDGNNMEFYVANKTSDVFHHLDCRSAKKIKGSSMIHFENVKSALNEGYKPCRLCKPGNHNEYGVFHDFTGQRKRIGNR